MIKYDLLNSILTMTVSVM